MAKKKNKKFKKSSANNKPVSPKIELRGEANVVAASNVTQEETPIRIVDKEKEELEMLNEKYKPIRHDVYKLLIVLGSLAVLFVAIYFLGTKTESLSTVGNWLYKISNIQTQ